MEPSRSTADRWMQVKGITADALERPETERLPFLAVACAGDDTLLAEVASLLDAHHRAGGFLETPGLAAPSAAEAVARAVREATTPVPAGRRVGPYVVLREIGRGGMGVVYLAARDDAAFEKQVAIKVVPGGLAGAGLMRRFREERRILATLDHPHIARLLDGGTTDEGLPYLVMEYVDGIPLDVYAQSNTLSVRDRLALFGMVCAAVQYAHQRLVIHRDLKSRNILVTPDGTPKLLDFGIAKLLEPGEDADDQTRTGMRALTLDAASPEQVRGEPLTVTSDVYALGVLLYRLLTGQSPYGPQRRTDGDMVHAICDETPARPSGRAPAHDARALRGDLDWITLKALRKEPDRRYASVLHLADDIQRHLAGRPVAAVPDSWGYRARKFAVRHRTMVAAAVVVALSVTAGLSATLWQASRAEAQRARAERGFTDARRLATSVVGELHDAIEALPGATGARSLLLNRACEHLDALAADAPDDPALAEDVANAYHRLGELQRSVNLPNLGEQGASLVSHRKALALRIALAERSPEDLEARSRLVASLIKVSYVEDHPRALARGRSAVTTATSLVAARPGESRFRKQLAQAHYAVGSSHRESGNNAEALASFEQATLLFEALFAQSPDDAEANRAVALAHRRVGAILADRRSPDALGHLRKALALDEERLARTPQAPRERRDVSVSSTQLGNGLMRAGDQGAALVPFRRALALREELVRDDPKSATAPRDLALALWWMARAQTAGGEPKAAIASLQRAMLLARPTSENDELPYTLASGLADAYDRSGDFSSSLRFRKQAVDGRRRLMARAPEALNIRREQAEDHAAFGATLARSGRWVEARAVYEEGLAIAAGLTGVELEADDATTVETLRTGLAGAAVRTAAR